MGIITIQDMQRDLPGFLKRVEDGESFLVIEDEKPVAEVRPVRSASSLPRPYGLSAGQFSVPADFDLPLPDEIVKEFEGA